MHQGVSASLSEGPAGPLDNHSTFAGKAVASFEGSCDPHIRLSSVDPRKLAPTLLTHYLADPHLSVCWGWGGPVCFKPLSNPKGSLFIAPPIQASMFHILTLEWSDANLQIPKPSNENTG